MTASVMRNSYCGGNVARETWNYLWHRICIILPIYATVAMIALIIVNIPFPGWHTLCNHIGYMIFDFALFTSSGLTGFRFVGVAWYISAMLLAMWVLYPLLLKNRDLFFYLVAPLCTLFVYGFLLQTKGHLSYAMGWNGVVMLGLLRAFAGISLGCVAYFLAIHLRKFDFTTNFRVLLTIIEVNCYILPLFFMHWYKLSKLDFNIVFLFFVGAVLTFSQQTYMAKRFVANSTLLGNFSLALYLCHAPLTGFVKRMTPGFSYEQRLACFLLASVIVASLIVKVVAGGQRYYQEHRLKFMSYIIRY